MRAEKFLSTPSARRATSTLCEWKNKFPISIHALREEGDRRLLHLPQMERNFYPRPPRGGRRFGQIQRFHAQQFLSTPSARRATCCDRRTLPRC